MSFFDYEDKITREDENRTEKIRQKVIDNNNNALSELGIPPKNLTRVNFNEIITVEILKPIFLSIPKNRTRKPDPKIMEELEYFEHVEIFARFPLSLTGLKRIKKPARKRIDKTMTWHYDKFDGLKNKEMLFSRNPLKVWRLEKNKIPIGEATLRQKIEHLLSKKSLMKKLGIENRISFYNMSKEKIRESAKKTKIKKTSPKSIKKKGVTKTKQKKKQKAEQKTKEKEANQKIQQENQTFPALIFIPVASLQEFNENIKELNKNIKTCIKAFEEFSEKF